MLQFLRISFNQYLKTGFIVYITALLFLIFGTIESHGQFVSGSTGADGAFAPTANQTVQLPESGVLNYTTVNIPSGVTVNFTPNSQNTPVTILATGNVVIAGIISVDGQNALSNAVGGKGGPGGAKGGTGGFLIDSFTGTTGDGRGGGSGGWSNNGADVTGGGGGGFALAGSNSGYTTAPYGIGGPSYGTSSLLPLMGGSGGGGGGGSTPSYNTRSGGGGGAGAVLIASSGTLTINGSITAIGGNGGYIYGGGTGGGGSGGAVRLIANTLVGTGSIDVRGGYGGGFYWGGSVGGNGGRGYFRAETYDYSAFNPSLGDTPLNISLPNSVFPPNTPQLRISSVAGVAVPLSPKGSLQNAPDIVLPSALTNPVEIQIAGTNIPTGSTVQVTVTPPSGSRTVYQSSALSGSVGSSTAAASINLPDGVSVISVSITVNLQASAALRPIYIDGEKIDKIEIAATLGNDSQIFYVTKSGKKLKAPKSN